MTKIIYGRRIKTKAHSHKQLGAYLAEKYISDAPRRYIRVFKIGCVEPDKNFITYLKGSFRHQWLRGHNWGNTTRYMNRLSKKLEQREKLRLLDFYKLGKLIHYTADAFTLAHNDYFGDNLKEHRSYETKLENYFPWILQLYQHAPVSHCDSVFDLIRTFHNDYLSRPKSVHTDAAFSITVCSSVLDLLILNRRDLQYQTAEL